MLKTIEIDGKKVRFESRGSTILRYKKQFHRDFLADIMKMKDLMVAGDDPTYEQIKTLDMEVFFNIAWTLAKTADNSIPEPMEFLDQFEEFPIMDVMLELNELITQSFATTKKKSRKNQKVK